MAGTIMKQRRIKPRKPSKPPKKVLPKELPASGAADQPAPDVPDIRTWSKPFDQPRRLPPSPAFWNEPPPWVPQPPPAPIPSGWMNTDDGTHRAVQANDAARRRNLAAITDPADSQAWLSPMGLGSPRVLLETAALHQEILRRVAAVEDAIAALSVARGGIGHNKSPVPIEDAGFDDHVLRAIESGIAFVRAQHATSTIPPAETREVVDQFRTTGTKTRDYVVKQGDNFVSELVKGGAKLTLTAAIAAGPLVVLYILALRLMAAADAIQAWLDVFGLPH